MSCEEDERQPRARCLLSNGAYCFSLLLGHADTEVLSDSAKSFQRDLTSEKVSFDGPRSP